MPNSYLYKREGLPPASLQLAEALDAIGVLTPGGLRATSEAWGQVDFTERVRWEKAVELRQQLVVRLRREGLPGKEASEGQAGWLVNRWQMPMYKLEFSPIPVSMEELEAARQDALVLHLY